MLIPKNPKLNFLGKQKGPKIRWQLTAKCILGIMVNINEGFV